MPRIPGIQETGKATIDFNIHDDLDRVGFIHLAFPQPDGTVRVDLVGGYSCLENATIGALNHMMAHVDHAMLTEEKAAEMGRMAAVAARAALAECRAEKTEERNNHGRAGRMFG